MTLSLSTRLLCPDQLNQLVCTVFSRQEIFDISHVNSGSGTEQETQSQWNIMRHRLIGSRVVYRITPLPMVLNYFEALASPAMGYWGTCPSTFNNLMFFSVNFRAAQNLTATLPGCLFVFCDSSYGSSAADTRTSFSALFRVILHATKIFVQFCAPLASNPGDATAKGQFYCRPLEIQYLGKCSININYDALTCQQKIVHGL